MRRNENNSPYSAALTGCGFMLDETDVWGFRCAICGMEGKGHEGC